MATPTSHTGFRDGHGPRHSITHADILHADQASFADSTGWTLREQLLLIQAVYRLGDNNWGDISRQLRPLKSSSRPSHFFSAKNCMDQYQHLLASISHNDSVSKRQKYDSRGRDPLILELTKRLYHSRIAELKQALQRDREKYMQLQDEINQVMSGELDHSLERIARELEQERIRTGRPLPSDAVQTTVLAAQDISMPNFSAAGTGAAQTPKPAARRGRPPGSSTPASPTPIADSTESPSSQPVSYSATPMAPIPVRATRSRGDVASDDTTPTPLPRGRRPLHGPSRLRSHPGTPAADVADVINPAALPPATSELAETSVKAEPVEEAGVGEQSGSMPGVKEEATKAAEPAAAQAPSATVAVEDGNFDMAGINHAKADQSTKKQSGRTSRRSSAPGTPGTPDMVSTPAAPLLTVQEASDKSGDEGSVAGEPPPRIRRRSNRSSRASSRANTDDEQEEDAEEEERRRKQFRKATLTLLQSIRDHSYANVFANPVSAKEAPQYTAIIKRPMDLSTLRRHVEDGSISRPEEFARDCLLIFANAMMYNDDDHDVYICAKEMRDDVRLMLDQYLAVHHVRKGGDELPHNLRHTFALPGPRGRLATPPHGSDNAESDDDKPMRKRSRKSEPGSPEAVSKRRRRNTSKSVDEDDIDIV